MKKYHEMSFSLLILLVVGHKRLFPSKRKWIELIKGEMLEPNCLHAIIMYILNMYHQRKK